MPDGEGLLKLASLKLPTHCLPLSHRALSADHAGQIAAALASGSLDALHCCTECHRAGLAQPANPRLIAAVQQNCQACHRG
jgi:hypothetical protein